MATCPHVTRLLRNADASCRQRLYNTYLEDMIAGINEPCFGDRDNDPIFCDSIDRFKECLSSKKTLIRSRQRYVKTRFEVSDEIRQAFMKGTQNEQFIMFHMVRNDYASSTIRWVSCQTFIGMRLHNAFSNDDEVCETSDSNGTKHLDLPEELMDLSIAEKLLIQKRAVLLPVVHMQKNKLGRKGHAVMFEKNVDDHVCTSLPRTKVEMVYVVRQYTNSTSNEVCQGNFKVQRDKVLRALVWLKKHHIGYRDILIDENNLSWMNNENEMELSESVISNHRVDGESTNEKASNKD